MQYLVIMSVKICTKLSTLSVVKHTKDPNVHFPDNVEMVACTYMLDRGQLIVARTPSPTRPLSTVTHFWVVTKWRCLPPPQHVQNDSPSSKSLAGLVVQLLQFQEDAFGRRVNNPALTKLPVSCNAGAHTYACGTVVLQPCPFYFPAHTLQVICELRKRLKGALTLIIKLFQLKIDTLFYPYSHQLCMRPQTWKGFVTIHP